MADERVLVRERVVVSSSQAALGDAESMETEVGPAAEYHSVCEAESIDAEADAEFESYQPAVEEGADESADEVAPYQSTELPCGPPGRPPC